MYKVAIPVFLNRISPRLDCALKLLLLVVEDQRLVARSELDISRWPPDERIFYLNQMGIKQVICGGIRDWDRRGLNRFGIRVASSVYGEIDPIIEKFLNGNLANKSPNGRGCEARKRRGKPKKWSR